MIRCREIIENVIICEIDSTFLCRSFYYEDKEKLYLTFLKGIVYSYQPISKDLYHEFEKDEAQGRYFVYYIKSDKNILYNKEELNEHHELNKLLKLYDNLQKN
jgi:hypothetical protein